MKNLIILTVFLFVASCNLIAQPTATFLESYNANDVTVSSYPFIFQKNGSSISRGYSIPFNYKQYPILVEKLKLYSDVNLTIPSTGYGDFDCIVVHKYHTTNGFLLCAVQFMYGNFIEYCSCYLISAKPTGEIIDCLNVYNIGLNNSGMDLCVKQWLLVSSNQIAVSQMVSETTTPLEFADVAATTRMKVVTTTYKVDNTGHFVATQTNQSAVKPYSLQDLSINGPQIWQLGAN